MVKSLITQIEHKFADSGDEQRRQEFALAILAAINEVKSLPSAGDADGDDSYATSAMIMICGMLIATSGLPAEDLGMVIEHHQNELASTVKMHADVMKRIS